MKQFIILMMVVFVMSLTTGCVTRTVNLTRDFSPELAVLPLGADTSMLDQEQSDTLEKVLERMDKNIIQMLGGSGFIPILINSEGDFIGADNRYLLKVSITDHKMIPEGVKYLVGSLAGTDRLEAHYDLIDSENITVLSWDDSQSSKHGVNYCATIINRNAVNKLVKYFSQR